MGTNCVKNKVLWGLTVGLLHRQQRSQIQTAVKTKMLHYSCIIQHKHHHWPWVCYFCKKWKTFMLQTICKQSQQT